MILEKYLVPDYVFSAFTDVTPEFVKSISAAALLCDIDNTLATYDDPTPPDNVVRWIDEMQKHGVSIAFVSNNEWERVKTFNRDLGLVAYAKAGKPGTDCLQRAANDLGLDKDRCALLGDQLLTDCAAGKRFGISTIIVPPIKDKKTPFFRFKRLLEVPYMQKYRKLHPDERI